MVFLGSNNGWFDIDYISSFGSYYRIAEPIEIEFQRNCKLFNLYEEEKTMEKEFTKEDLKNRMVVEYRDGQRRMVVDNDLIGEHGRGYLTDYDDDLTNRWCSDLDIIRVFGEVPTFDMLSENRLRKIILWERKEPIEVTMKQVCEKFGCEVKIIDG